MSSKADERSAGAAMCRICWKSKFTGHTGEGSPIPKAEAETLCAEMNRVYNGNIEHWIEEVPNEH